MCAPLDRGGAKAAPEKAPAKKAPDEEAAPALPVEHEIGRALWRNVGVTGPSVAYGDLGVADFYALRAIVPGRRRTRTLWERANGPKKERETRR